MLRAAVLTIGLTAFATVAASTISHAQSAASPWPMFLHDRAHTGRSSADTRAISGTPNWKFSPDGVRRLLPPVIAADGTIYLGGTGLDPKTRHMSLLEYLYAVSPDGKLKWTFGDFMRASMDENFCPSIAADGTIYVGNSEYKSNNVAAGHLYAINPNGTLKWKFETGSWVSSSTTIGADGAIYLGSWDGNLYAVNPDGKLKWKFETADQVADSPAIGADSTIYIGSADFNLYALNPDGTLKWKFATNGGIGSSPAIGADGTIYAVSSAGSGDPGLGEADLYALDSTGKLKWKFAVRGGKFAGGQFSSPAIGADGVILVGSSDENLYAVNPNDGKLKWKFLNNGSVGGSPAIGGDGSIYVGSPEITALKPDGSVEWKFEHAGDTPAIGANGTLYIACGPNTSLCAFGAISR
jgi:outer membrane protein assembly factor BamB